MSEDKICKSAFAGTIQTKHLLFIVKRSHVPKIKQLSLKRKEKIKTDFYAI